MRCMKKRMILILVAIPLFVMMLKMTNTHVFTTLPSYVGLSRFWRSNQTYQLANDSASPNHMPQISDGWFSHCNDSYRQRHWITIDTKRGRTGNQLFRLFAFLTLARDYCYLPFLESNISHLTEIFDIYNVQRQTVDSKGFKEIRVSGFRYFDTSFFHKDKYDTNVNWTIRQFFQNYKYFQHQTDFIKASVKFKPSIMHEVNEFLGNKTLFGGSMCTVHIRRADRITPDNWYELYINKTMNYVRNKVARVNFVVISDDILWCKNTFTSPDILFSPFKNAGNDLALLAYSDHVIITMGTFGWMGAWLGNKGNNSLIISPGDWHKQYKEFYPRNFINSDNI